MGRKSVIIEIESKFGKPIHELLSELAADGDARYIKDKLGVSLRTAYNLMEECGIKPNSGGQTHFFFTGEISTLIQSYLESKESGGLTKASLDFYGNNMNRFLWWLDQEHIPPRLSSFSTVNITKFLLYLKNKEVRFGGKSTMSRRPVTRSTRDAYWRTFQSFATWLEIQGHIKEQDNPIGDRKHPKVPRPGMDDTVIPEVPADELKKIVESFGSGFQGKRDRALLAIFLVTGVRLSEIDGMQMPDISMDTGQIKIFGKGRRERIISIKPVFDIVKDYFKVRNPVNNFLWQRENGERLSKSAIQSLIKRWIRFCPPGMKLGPHRFRHNFAIEVLRNGGNPYTLKELGGWEDLDIPLKYAESAQHELALKDHEKIAPFAHLFNENGGNGHAKE